MNKPTVRSSTASAARQERKAPVFTARGGILAGAGVVSIVAGFIVLSTGSITLAPVLLVLGYVVLVPLAILR
jgi:hypothetical protein